MVTSGERAIGEATDVRRQRAAAYPSGALVRVADICGDRKVGRPGLLPINPATWYRWVNDGRAPAGYRLGQVTRVWTVEEVLALAQPVEATS